MYASSSIFTCVIFLWVWCDFSTFSREIFGYGVRSDPSDVTPSPDFSKLNDENASVERDDAKEAEGEEEGRGKNCGSVVMLLEAAAMESSCKSEDGELKVSFCEFRRSGEVEEKDDVGGGSKEEEEEEEKDGGGKEKLSLPFGCMLGSSKSCDREDVEE